MTDTPVADLVDQHCHGVLRTELGLGTFEARLATAGGQAAPAPPSSTHIPASPCGAGALRC